MIENLAERLACSPHRWLIVTAVTFAIALASALPQVDQLLAERSEQAVLKDELAQSEATAKRLPAYEKSVAEKTEELERLRKRAVDESQVSTLRSWLVSAARQSGCQVRRIDMATPNSRPWDDKSSPIDPLEPGANKNTPFQLQTRNVTFSVTGTSTELVALLKAIDDDSRLKHTNSIDLKPTSRNAHELQLDLSLWYFALVRNDGVA